MIVKFVDFPPLETVTKSQGGCKYLVACATVTHSLKVAVADPKWMQSTTWYVLNKYCG